MPNKLDMLPEAEQKFITQLLVQTMARQLGISPEEILAGFHVSQREDGYRFSDTIITLLVWFYKQTTKKTTEG